MSLFVVALQYYEGDKAEAERLGRFIADIEPERREDVKIVLVRRWDAPRLSKDTLDHVAKKFPLYEYKTRTPWLGWPGGCNAMVLDFVTNWFWQPTKFDGVLLLEPDTVPLAKDWLNQIIAEWETARAAGAWLMGSWRNSGGQWGHINGNCVLRSDFSRLVDMSRITPHLAWDCAIVPQVKDHWHVSGLFKNCFQSVNATEETLRVPEIGDKPPVLVHGYKDGSAYEIARRWLL